MICASSISLGSITCCGTVAGFSIELGNELLHHLGICRILRPFKDEVFAPDQFAAAYKEDLHAGFPVTARHSQYVRVQVIGCKDDALSFDDGLNGFELVAYCGGFLETHFFGCLMHILFETRDNALAVSAEKIHQVRDHLAVLGLGRRANAGSGTQLDVKVKTRTFVHPGDLAVTRQVGKYFPQDIQCLINRPRRCIRTEVARSIVRHLPGDGHMGKRLVPMDFDVWITLVVLEADVVFGAMFLDEVHLKDERLKLGPDNDPLDIGDIAHETAGLRIVTRI